MSGSRRLVRERRHDLEERQELHRHVIDEPDAVVRTVERAPGGMHAERFDLDVTEQVQNGQIVVT